MVEKRGPLARVRIPKGKGGPHQPLLLTQREVETTLSLDRPCSMRYQLPFLLLIAVVTLRLKTTGDATNYFHCQSLPTPSTNCDSTHLPIIQCHDALTFDSRYYNADRCSGSYKHVNHGEIPPCCQPRGVRDLFLTYFSYCSIWCVFLDESRSTDLVSRGPVDRVARMLCTWHLTQLTAGVRLWDIGESSCVCLG